jgi:hypothetical protein
VDFRALNDISSISSAPIGNIEDNLDRLSRSTVFSSIDSIGAFHVIELKDKVIANTAFATPWGSYQFVRMPFGLAGGPSSYARLVYMVLDGIPYTQALPYLDDTPRISPDTFWPWTESWRPTKRPDSSSSLPNVSFSRGRSST